MKHYREFAWIVGSGIDVAVLTASLSSREPGLLLASLFERDEQAEPISTADVTSVVVEHIRAYFWRVTANVEFEAGPRITFSPYTLSGKDDVDDAVKLPRLTCFTQEKLTGDIRQSLNGEPDRWGTPSRRLVNRAALDGITDDLDDARSYAETTLSYEGDFDEDGSENTFKERVDGWGETIEHLDSHNWRPR